MRWADPGRAAMPERLAIFPATARFLIALAAGHLGARMMPAVPEPIDGGAASQADYGALLVTSGLPT
jgi:hypothetical protein